MSLGNEAGVLLGSVSVLATDGRGLNADEITDLCMRKLMFVGVNAPPAIRDQAIAYEGRIRALIHGYVTMAQQGAAASAIARLEQAGMADAARVLRGN